MIFKPRYLALKVLAVSAITLILCATVPSALAQTSDEQAVRNTVDRLLVALGNGDLDALPSMFTTDANVGIVRMREGTWTTFTQSFEDWFKAAKASDRSVFYEPVEKISIHVESGHLALVRAETTIVVDGEIRANNTDYFTLVREQDVWKFMHASYITLRATPD
jgi:ketosteroid isomerase-like protein